jgi:hypothetical protein
MTYTATGPDDVAVIAKQPAGLGIIHLRCKSPPRFPARARSSFKTQIQTKPPPPAPWRRSEMSFAQRRKFLWICFLAGLLLLSVTAAFANATTFARLRFEDLAQQSSAVARLRCLGSEFRWERGELWTETRFEVLERNKEFFS